MSKNYFFLVLCALLLTSCAKTIISKSKWISSSVIVDGQPDDWYLPLKYYDRESKLSYDIANDAQSLYVIIRATEISSQVKMLRQGMRLAIDRSGGSYFPIELFYPLPDVLTLDDQQRNTPQEELVETREFRDRFLAAQSQFRLVGFSKTGTNGLMAIKNPYGIKVALAWDKQGVLYYEAAIPFSSFYKTQLDPADTIRPWNFRITVDGLVQAAAGGHLRDNPSPAENENAGHPLLSNGGFASGNVHVGFDRPQNPERQENAPEESQYQHQLFVANRIVFKLKLALK